MVETRVGTSTQVAIDGWSWRLPPDHDLVELMSQIETAARSGPSFVPLCEGEDMVSVLIGPQSKVAITVSPQRSDASENTPVFEHTLAPDMADWEL